MYYVSSGKVIDYYPLFSVHQDAMAPMSLLQLQNVTGKDYSEFVLLSLKWLDKNILGETMILSGKETVWRAIQRRPGGFRELYLGLGALGVILCGTGIKKLKTNYEIVKECRPYHLGWILLTRSKLAI